MPRAVKVCVSLLCPQISSSRLSLRKSRHLHRPKVSSVWVWVGALRRGVCVCSVSVAQSGTVHQRLSCHSVPHTHKFITYTSC